MPRYDIVTGILLILSIIDFAVAAPVIVQEKRQASVDVVHIPKDVMTVLGKRGPVGEGVLQLSQIDLELEKMWEDYFDNLDSADSASGTHTPTGSDPPEPDHGTTNVVHAPAPNPNPPSSTANPDPGPSYDKSDDESNWPPYTPTSSGYSSDREFMEAHVLQPNDPRPSPDSDSSMGTGPELDWDHLMILKDSPRPRPPPGQLAAGSSQELFAGQAQEYQVDPSHANSQPSTSGYAPLPPTVPEHEVVTPPSESAESLNLGSLSSSADSQPVDLQADTYAAKESRRSISGAASLRDYVGNAAQRESQPAKRSLDPGENPGQLFNEYSCDQ